MNDVHLIYKPRTGKSMNIAVFASGGGNNLITAIETAKDSDGRIRVCLVVTDRLGIPAIDIARSYNIEVIAKDFEKQCGVWSKCKDDPLKARQYSILGKRFHDEILTHILDFEEKSGLVIDIVVLSYHRFIRGRLFDHFQGRMINQHPGDLSALNSHMQRKYIGMSPVFNALRDGNSRTRTVNFLVRKGCDDGEILCSGPWVEYKGPLPVTRESAWEHEVLQKKLSDKPCLRSALNVISQGRIGLYQNKYHPDGRHVISFDSEELPYQGYDLDNNA